MGGIVGGFAALARICNLNSCPSVSLTLESLAWSAGAIVGGVVGGICTLALLLVAALLYRRQRHLGQGLDFQSKQIESTWGNGAGSQVIFACSDLVCFLCPSSSNIAVRGHSSSTAGGGCWGLVPHRTCQQRATQMALSPSRLSSRGATEQGRR